MKSNRVKFMQIKGLYQKDLQEKCKKNAKYLSIKMQLK